MLHDLVVEGKVVNPEGVYEAQIGIDDGYITEIKKQGLRAEKTVAARGCLIFPGFIDIHAHLREDSSHKWDYKEDFGTGSAAAVHGGITTVVDMPNTPLPGINADRIRKKRELARATSKGLIDVFFYGGVTESNLSAIADMQKEVVGYKIYLCETTGGLYIRDEMLPAAIKALQATSKPVVIHCEDQRVIEKKKEELKVKGSRSYSGLRPEEAELAAVSRVLSTVSRSASGGHDRAKIKVNTNIAHVSVYETLSMIKPYKNVHGEVTPHHLFFNNEDVRAKQAFLKMNPPLRAEENRQRLLDALKRGEIDFLATDHAPHTQEEKSLDFSVAPAGVPNLDTYGNFVSWLIVRCDVRPELISRLCAYNPAAFLGLDDRGHIEAGKRANLTVLDLHRSVKICGERLYTKCGWSPFEGYEFPGAVRHTIFNGVILSEYDELTGFEYKK